MSLLGFILHFIIFTAKMLAGLWIENVNSFWKELIFQRSKKKLFNEETKNKSGLQWDLDS